MYYPRPLYAQPVLEGRGLEQLELPGAERLCREVLSLPLHPGLTADDAGRVAGEVREFFQAR